MTRFDTPEGCLAEYLITTEPHASRVKATANDVWARQRGRRGRNAAFADDLKSWVRDEVVRSIIALAEPDDLIDKLLDLAVDRFDWPIVAEIAAEELEMPGT